MRIFVICSFIIALLFLQSCYDQLPSDPEVVKYVPPILIATNMPSKLHPRDIFPLDSGNFWIYKTYGKNEVDGKITWVFQSMDTVYVEKDTLAIWSYWLGANNLPDDTTNTIGTEVTQKKLRTYVLSKCYQGKYGLYPFIPMDVGNYFARLDTNWILFGNNLRPYCYGSVYANLTEVDGPGYVQFTNFINVETELGSFKNCKVYSCVWPLAASFVPGIGPVAYYWGTQKGEAKVVTKLVAYGIK